jgi:Flp pilus assembly protein TadG
VKLPNLTRRPFVCREDGTTVEFVLWVPILFLIIALAVDASMAFARQSHMWRIATDIGRGLSTGRIKTGDIDRILAAVSLGRAVYQMPTPTVNGRYVTSTVTVPLSSATPFGVLGQITGLPLTASVTMELQPHVQSIH